jgi:hypothetical protein
MTVVVSLIFLATFAPFAVKPLIYFQKFKSDNRKERKARKELPQSTPRKSNSLTT